MNKDVIYIDVEDDITAIIGKVKDASAKIVALVPPKRVGILQSAVNLRLLTRAADQAKKRLVLISNDSALMALASAAKIPVAKNLQSKPELAQIPALSVDEDDDIIDGSSLPVGELERTADRPDDKPIAEAATGSALGAAAIASNGSKATPPAPGQALAKPRVKSGVKVPNFSSFRKKLILVGAALVLVVGFLVWAIAFAPHAKVIVTARTTDASLNDQVTLTGTGNTDVKAKTLKMTTQQIEKDVSHEFNATGEKDVGEKATGTVKLSKLSQSETPVPAGTKLTSNGLVFITDSSVTIPESQPCFPSFCAQSVTVTVTAENSGSNYNGADGSLTGAPDGASAEFTDSTSGGTDKTITVVSDEDIQKAKEDLTKQDHSDLIKKLKEQFGKDIKIIEDTFKVDINDVKSTPAVDAEAADGKAKLTGSITYTMAGIAKSELKQYLSDYFNQQLGKDSGQRIYDNGVDSTTFTNISAKDSTFTANMVANAKIGPKIEDQKIKDMAKGKRYGDIQSSIEAIQGVDNVDIKFSPFWVSQAPDDTKRITVEFKLNDK